MKKNLTYTLLISTIILGLLTIFLFSKCTTTKKHYSPDQQYSVYARTYWYAELFCAAFSTFDCSYEGEIYLYDEVEQEIIEFVYVSNVSNIETVSWTYSNTVLFKEESIKISNGAWVLPRPMSTKL